MIDLKGVFPDISKAFDKVWHNGVIYKLKQNGAVGDFIFYILWLIFSKRENKE